MDGEKNKAFAYQLKCRNTKYSFIIVENKNQEPISVLAYKGAIVARPGFVFLEGGLFYFIGYDKGARAKCIDEKMIPAEVALASMTSLALSHKVPYLDIIDNLEKDSSLETMAGDFLGEAAMFIGNRLIDKAAQALGSLGGKAVGTAIDTASGCSVSNIWQ